MTDIENEVCDLVSAALRAKFPNITVYSKTVLSPSEFPSVSIEEGDNYTYTASIDSSGVENHSSVMYEVNIYSNKVNRQKSECKEIFAVLDELLIKKGFVRTMRKPVSMDDATKYRITVRYKATIGKDKQIYRR